MNKKRELQYLVLSCIVAVINSLTIVLTTEGITRVMECIEIGQTDSLWRYFLQFAIIIIAEKITSIGFEATKLMYTSVGDYCRRTELVTSIFKKALKEFKSKGRAFYFNIITSDVSTIRQNRLESIPWLAYFTAYLIFSIVMLCRIDLMMTLVIVSLSFFPFFLDKMFSKIVQKRQKIHTEQMEQYLGTLNEMLDNVETIKNNCAERPFVQIYKQACKTSRKSFARVTFANNLSQETLYFTASVLRFVALVISGIFAANGRINVALIYGAINYSTAISNSFSNLANYSVNIKSTKYINQKIESEICSFEDTIIENKEERMTDCNDMSTAIKISNLDFSFGERKVFSKFSYSFQVGRKYAIVGLSGSGKTTLLNIILNNYDDYTGEVSLFGHNTRLLDSRGILKHIAIVEQEPHIFNTSLFENITMYNDSISEDSDEYLSIISKLQLLELMKEVGSRRLGDFGDKISGGEKQRICLARAVLRNTPVLILDESTNGLDPYNKGIIEEYILTQKDKTVIAVTHDWSSENLKQFDEVLSISATSEDGCDSSNV